MSPQVQRFAALIREETGNMVPAERYSFLAEVAERRARAMGQPDVASYLDALAGRALEGEWERLIPLVTIKESYFFRAPQQFDAILRQVLPGLLRARAESRRLRLWSAACARGEEPGTLALLLAEERALAGWDWKVLATDVDAEAVEGARRGLYGERAVAQVPPDLLARHFARRGKLFELSPLVRERVEYRQLNLAHAPYPLGGEAFDLILLRNVLIYFRRPLQRWVIGQVAQRLAPGGLLFLGASETVWQIQDDLEALDLGSCFGYRPKTEEEKAEALAARAGSGAARKARDAEARPSRTPPRVAGPPPASPSPGGSRPVLPSDGEGPGRAPVRRNPPPWPVAEKPAREASAGPAPAVAPSTAGGVQEKLLHAARLLAGNEVAESERLLGEVLAADPSEPAAHALEGFLHDLVGRADEALASYRAALYLEPELYQARLLLADCLLRRGHRDQADHQYREVLATLAGGRERTLTALEDLPFPDPDRARRRCRQVLGRG